MNRVEYATYKSDKKRLILQCRDEHGKCQWHLRAKKGIPMWEITRDGEAHSCERDVIPKDNPHFNKDFIAMDVIDLIKEKLRYTPGAIRRIMGEKYGYEISYFKAWEARQKALKMLFGD
ncbi:hypothetical protein QQ045_012285 [Rhodiola kirilowii]